MNNSWFDILYFGNLLVIYSGATASFLDVSGYFKNVTKMQAR